MPASLNQLSVARQIDGFNLSANVSSGRDLHQPLIAAPRMTLSEMAREKVNLYKKYGHLNVDDMRVNVES